jgi:hypothetical protein
MNSDVRIHVVREPIISVTSKQDFRVPRNSILVYILSIDLAGIY